MEQYPEELREKPRPVVGFLGGSAKLHNNVVSHLSFAHAQLPQASPAVASLASTLATTPGVLSNNNSASAALSAIIPSVASSTATELTGNSSRARSLYVISLQGGETLFLSNKGSLSASTSSTSGLLSSSPIPSSSTSSSTRDSSSFEDSAGVLKANWMHKHTHVVPSVILLFFNDWGKANRAGKWPEREAEFIALLESTRASIKTRNTKLLVVLVQRNTMAESSPDERFNTFRKKTELHSKNILYYCKSDAKTSVKRIEKTVMDLASTYYREIAQIKKKKRERLHKNSQPSIYVRYCFKVGFLSEFRDDVKTALKYYIEGYKYLPRVTRDRLRMTELKIVADFINFKICKLYMGEGGTEEAVQQFCSHIKTFKQAIGMQEKEYEHWAWLSRQYQVFGELLKHDNRDGWEFDDNALYFPGHYFNIAANYAIKRKLLAQRLCEPIRDSPVLEKYTNIEPFSLVSADRSKQEYIGQHYMFFESHPLEDSDKPQVPDEMDQLYRSWATELKVPHSALILALLKAASEWYKKVNKSRMLLHIASRIANEYIFIKQYKEAKEYFDYIALAYKKELWTPLMVPLLTSALVPALALKLTKDYILYSLDLIAPQMPTNLKDKQLIQTNIVTALVSPQSLSLPPLDAPIIRTNDPSPFIYCRAQFAQDTVLSKETTTLSLLVQSSFPDAIRFSRIIVLFSDTRYNCSLVDNVFSPITPEREAEEKQEQNARERHTDLAIPAKGSKIFTVEILAYKPTQVAVTAVWAEIGTDPALLRFVCNITTSTPQMMQYDTERKRLISGVLKKDMEQVKLERSFPVRTALTIKEQRVGIRVKMSHAPPALVNEFYRVDVALYNIESTPTSLTLQFHLEPPFGSVGGEVGQCFYIGQGSSRESLNQLHIAELRPGHVFHQTIYVHFPAPGNRNIVVEVAYESPTQSKVVFHKLKRVTIHRPFFINYSIYSRDMQLMLTAPSAEITKPKILPGGEPFFVQAELVCNTPYPLMLKSTSLELNSAIATCTSEPSALSARLENGDKYSAWFQVKPSVTGERIDFGCFRAVWSRCKTQYKYATIEDFEAQGAKQKTLKSAAETTVTKDKPQKPSGPKWDEDTPTSEEKDKREEKTSVEAKKEGDKEKRDQKDIVEVEGEKVSIVDPLPPVAIQLTAFVASVQLPASGTVGEVLPFTLSIRNNTAQPQAITVSVKENHLFLFSGDQHSAVTLRPHETHLLAFHLLPVSSGHLALPLVTIFAKRYNCEVRFADRHRTVFVKPAN